MNIKVTFLMLFIILAQILAACGNALAGAGFTPTAEATPTADPAKSAKIVEAFWDALELGDVETAMTYVADDVTCAGFCHFTGKQSFQSYLQGYLNTGYVTKVSDVKTVGSIVTYSWEVHRRGVFLRRGDSDEMMQVEDGLIVYWENHHR